MTEPIGLSTAWNGPGFSPDRLLEEHRRLGFRRLEAYAHYTPDALEALAQAAHRQDMEIASLHGPCPVPASGGIGDWLASTSPSERTRSVDAHKATIDAAAKYGAKAVVIHLGNSGVMSRQRALIDVVEREGRLSDGHLRLRDQAWQEREANKGPHLEAAIQSIRALGEHAKETGVRLGLECRDNYQEIPSLDEFADVLGACDGLPVGYWHDAGHGAKLDYLGFFEHEELLRRYGHLLVGMHIHDTRAARDHQAPGQGDTNFAMLARYLREDTIRTLELSRSVAAADITRALDVLEPLGVFGVAEGILVSS
ncbi:MAG: sugar phosphate isomerase/epimerase [Chloroflexi bacterium]|nr:sugar phosphate isomerase/epimerase [Chloroflexota bacterium]MBV9133853.1 sugar phosphate isomerase/epimerase [Chloroflexota bacterium]MBV9895906.1 sugar phosphate isomerase/epimerase [Chloroflexota bacterium]